MIINTNRKIKQIKPWMTTFLCRNYAFPIFAHKATEYLSEVNIFLRGNNALNTSSNLTKILASSQVLDLQRNNLWYASLVSTPLLWTKLPQRMNKFSPFKVSSRVPCYFLYRSFCDLTSFLSESDQGNTFEAVLSNAWNQNK